MITDLGKLTMAQYVELLCGDTSVLRPGTASAEEVADVRLKLMYDYLSLSNPTEYASQMARQKDSASNKMTYLMFATLSILVQLGQCDSVRSVLGEYGIGAGSMTDEKLAAEVKLRMNRAKADMERGKQGEDSGRKAVTPEQIRLSYDRQAASLMTYFKFQIDMSTIKATTFACMIDQADRETKARLAAMKK